MTARIPDPAKSSIAADGSHSGAGPERAGEETVKTPSPAQPTYIPVRAAEDMLAVRAEQIFKFGHTPQADAGKPLHAFAHDLENLARAILEDVQFTKPHDRIRRRLVKLGALAMATIDRIDNEGEARDGRV